jgi:hypothetical protein
MITAAFPLREIFADEQWLLLLHGSANLGISSVQEAVLWSYGRLRKARVEAQRFSQESA